MFDYKHSVIYQIWPRSFKDSNGDGIGDINGIRSKLDYLSQLGIDAIWISPVYLTNNDDYGYDVSDYEAINPEYGTMEELQALINEAKQRNIAIIMDFVANHTSTSHPWFQEALNNPASPYRGYYIFKKGDGDTPPNNWLSFFGTSAWQRAEDDMYYLTLYADTQADLNWKNEEMREKLYSAMRMYLEMGCAGFRMDTINTIVKIDGLPSKNPQEKGLQFPDDYIIDRPEVEIYLKEIREKVLKPYDAFVVGEGVKVTPECVIRYTRPENEELDMMYQFDLVMLGFGELGKYDCRKLYHFTHSDFKEVTRKWQNAMQDHGGWMGNYLSSHDQQRQLNRFGDTGRYRAKSAKMLAVYNFCLYGTPFIYQGEEIGMINPKLTKADWKDYECIHSCEAMQQMLHVPAVLAEKISSMVTRDNGRTPVQWAPLPHAGFSEQEPWMVITDDYLKWNAGSEDKDPDSVLNFYRQLTRFRKKHEALCTGSIREVIPEHRHVIGWYRECEEETLLILINLSGHRQKVKLEEAVSGTHLFGNDPEKELAQEMELLPYEAHIWQIRA